MFLDKCIEDLLTFYRAKWPDCSITPKLHMLEDHVTEFITKWGRGLGTYGEQGGESIHPTFNRLYDIHSRMQPCHRRLMSMLKSHHVAVNPNATKLKTQTCGKRKWVKE